MKQILFFALFAIAAIMSGKAQDTIYYNDKGVQLAKAKLASFKSVTVADPADSSLYICKIYWMSGQIRKELRYKIENKDAVYVGRHTEWHPNGALKSEVNYVNGKKEGEEKTYDESNKLIERAIFAKGKYIKGLDANGEELIFTVIEQMPQFTGGEDALRQFITDNLHYPSVNLNSDIQGSVYVRFAVGSDGKISKASAIKGLGSGFDEEAIRVVLSMPPWIPGAQGGRPTPVWFILPIRFVLPK